MCLTESRVKTFLSLWYLVLHWVSMRLNITGAQRLVEPNVELHD